MMAFDRICLDRWRANGTKVIADLCLSFPDQQERSRIIEVASALTGLVISMSEFKAYFGPGGGVPSSATLHGGLEFMVVHTPSRCWVVTKAATVAMEGVEVEGANVLAAGDRFAAKFLSELIPGKEIRDAADFAFHQMQGEFWRLRDET
jgi:sugar/nucleoside kinase (ribokinase family)